MANHVGWFEIHAAPGGRDALKQFYSSAFDWEYDVQEGYSMVRAADDGPGIGGAVDEGERGAGVIIFIEVDDPAASLASVTANGGEVVQDVTEVPGMVTYATFRDPAGNVIGLVASEVPPA